MKVLGYFLIVLLAASCAADTDFIQQLLEEPIVPTKVTLIFPENNSECTTGITVSDTESEVTFDWSDAEIGDSYLLTLTNLSNGQNQTFDSSISSMPIRLLVGTPYSWKITSYIDGSTEVTDSDTESFYNSGPGIQTYVPFPATNPTPSAGSFFPSTTTTLDISWEGNDLDDDIIEYDFYFGTVNPPPLESPNLQTAFINGVSISSGNTYYWKVTTRDSAGNESNSEVFYFGVN